MLKQSRRKIWYSRARVKQQLKLRFESGAAMAESDEAASVPRLALTPVEAARALGCSRDFFD
jgi:hypothetical protein